MPPRRKAAKKEATPPPPPLQGCTITLIGKFSGVGHTKVSLEKLVNELGGGVAKTLAKSTTHLICSEDEWASSGWSHYGKVSDAKNRGLPILKPEWILDCEEKMAKLDEADYACGTAAKPANGAAASGTANGSSQDSDKTKKRPIAVANANGKDEPKTKKTRGAKASSKANGDADVKTDADDAKVKADPDADEAEEDSKVAEGQFLKKKKMEVPRDEYCPLTTFSVYIHPESGMIFDANLNQSNSTNNNNKFYRVQILHESSSGTFKTWTRWGRVGEMGSSAELGNGTFEDAIKQFEKKFKDKSGLPWDKRGDDPKPGKYAFVERNYDPDSDEDDDEEMEDAKGTTEDGSSKTGAPPECTLDKPIKELMELIFNQQYFQATMTALNYDAKKLPLGKLSKATIMRGFQQLKDLAALMDDSSLAASRWNMPLPNAVEHLSNTYYSVIPHAFGRNRPPIIRDDALLKKEIELLESLSDMKDAADIMKIDRKAVDTVHPLDRQFQGLNLNEMTPLEHKSSEFTLLADYLQGSKGQTHNFNYKVEEIFRIERSGEKFRFDSSPFATIPSNRRLLWHGSRCTNFGGILSQGLRIAPPEAPVSGYMFGKGIYLADMSSKSAGYCASGISNGQALLLLCEAELGDPMQELTGASYQAGETAKKNGMYSTWGQGRTGPTKWVDAGSVHESLKGIKMPDPSTNGPTGIDQASLYYNEYIAYDVAQVKLRYLFRVRM